MNYFLFLFHCLLSGRTQRNWHDSYCQLVAGAYCSSRTQSFLQSFHFNGENRFLVEQLPKDLTSKTSVMGKNRGEWKTTKIFLYILIKLTIPLVLPLNSWSGRWTNKQYTGISFVVSSVLPTSLYMESGKWTLIFFMLTQIEIIWLVKSDRWKCMYCRLLACLDVFTRSNPLYYNNVFVIWENRINISKFKF